MYKRFLMAGSVLAGALLINIPAQADELSDLKAQLNKALDRIDQLEAKSAAQPAPVAAPAPAPTGLSLGNVITSPSGFQWNLYGRGDIGFVQDIGSDTPQQHKSVVTNHFNAGEMTSRLGLTGSWAPYNQDEYKAIFAVETGVNLFNGVVGGSLGNVPAGSYGGGSTLLNRGATVGISSKTYGSLEGGNMYMAPFWVILGADLASAHDYGANDFSALYTVTKFDALGKYLKNPPSTNSSSTSALTGAYSGTGGFYGNAVRYRTPNYEGFTGEFSFSMGQQPGFNGLATGQANQLGNDGRTYAGNILYNNGPLFIGYAHQNTFQDADISLSSATNSAWSSRNQNTDILGARYKWRDLEVGGSYTRFSVSNAGGYLAQAYGVSASYDIGKHRIESSLAKITYGGANGTGSFGANTGDGKGKPEAAAFALGYLYNIAPNWSAYTYYEHIFNNSHSGLDTPDFRGNVSSSTYGFNPTEWTVGMFYVF
jgi:predicted porin